MKKAFKGAAIALAAVLTAASITGCSQDGGEGVNTGEANNISAAEGTKAADTDTNKENEGDKTEKGDENSSEEITEPEEQKADESLFAYYDMLNEEYEKSGKLYDIRYTYVTAPGKIIICDRQKDELIKVYDVNKQSLVCEIDSSDSKSFWDYENWRSVHYYADVDDGYIYTAYKKYDLKGNIVAEADIDNNEEFIELFADGTMFTRSDSTYYMYSPDWKTKTEIPILQADIEHGLKKDISYTIQAKYKNKIYVYGWNNSKEFYCLDTDTNTWEKAGSELQNADFAYNDFVGRYWLMSDGLSGGVSKIYDMETDTFVAEINEPRFDLGYTGGKDHLAIRRDGDSYVLHRGRYPSDGSDYVYDDILSMEYFDGNWPVAINEQYYLYADDYGIFLREYGKGEEGEITVYLRDN